jgi:hypothetical protein
MSVARCCGDGSAAYGMKGDATTDPRLVSQDDLLLGRHRGGVADGEQNFHTFDPSYNHEMARFGSKVMDTSDP